MLDLSDEAPTLAEVDKDGEISIIDAAWIRRWELKMKAPESIGKVIL